MLLAAGRPPQPPLPRHSAPSLPSLPCSAAASQAMDEMIDKLVFVSKDNLTYIAEFER